MNTVRISKVRKHKEKNETTEKYSSYLKNTIAKIKNAPERIHNRLDDAEKWICNLENRTVEITETEQKKEF